MAELDLSRELEALLEAHGLPCTSYNGWVLPGGELPAMCGQWHPGEQDGRLDIRVLIEKGLTIEEHFAGVGQGVDGFKDAMQSFAVNSLPVLLAAFWHKPYPDQVVYDRWQVGQREFEVFVGDFGTRSSKGVHAAIPNELFASIRRTVEREALTGDTHWVRTFFCNLAGQQTFEALLDNEVWAAGADCLRANPWQASEGYHSVRNFMVLRASKQSKDGP